MINIDSFCQKSLFKFVRDMYDNRSSVAHGKKVDVSQERLSQREDILRLSVKRYLFDKGQFSLEVDELSHLQSV